MASNDCKPEDINPDEIREKTLRGIRHAATLTKSGKKSNNKAVEIKKGFIKVNYYTDKSSDAQRKVANSMTKVITDNIDKYIRKNYGEDIADGKGFYRVEKSPLGKNNTIYYNFPDRIYNALKVKAEKLAYEDYRKTQKDLEDSKAEEDFKERKEESNEDIINSDGEYVATPEIERSRGLFNPAVSDNETESKYQIPLDVDVEDYIPMEKTLRDLVSMLHNRIGLNYVFENYPKRDESYRIENGAVYINIAKMKPSTPVMSMLAEPLVISLRETKDGKKAYNNMLKELGRGLGENTLNKIKKKYPNISEESQHDKAIANLLTSYIMGNEEMKNGSRSLINTIKDMLKKLKDRFKELIGKKEVSVEDIPDDVSIKELADYLSYSNSHLVLPGMEVTYKVPGTNRVFKTYSEVNNYIREGIKDIPFIGKRGMVKPILEYFKTGKEVIKPELIAFIQRNHKFQVAMDYIKKWKKKNNISYNPNEAYDRGERFYSVLGAYTPLEIDKTLQDILAYLKANEETGNDFIVSAFTKDPTAKNKSFENASGVRIVLNPKSKDIIWASSNDAEAGSTKGVSEIFNSGGSTFTKAPGSAVAMSGVKGSIAEAISERLDNNAIRTHNEMGIALKDNNWRLEIDHNVINETAGESYYEVKRLVNKVNNILDERYGEFVEPDIAKTSGEILLRIENPSNNLKNIGEKLRDAYKKELENSDISSKQAISNAQIKEFLNRYRKFPRSLITSEVNRIKTEPTSGVTTSVEREDFTINDIKTKC